MPAAHSPTRLNGVSIHPVIRFDHIVKSFGSQRVLDDVSFDALSGRVTAVLGPNGAGKSTLFSILLGLISADSGEVRIGGAPLSDEALRAIGASVNGPAYYGHLGARDNVLVHARLLGLLDAEVDRALAVVGLTGTGRKPARKFSTGMKARLALAQAVLGDPEILVLDEPQNGLDPQGIVELRELLRGWVRRGGSVVVSSHQLGEVVHLADDVVVLAGGTVRYAGALDQLAAGGNLEAEFFRLTCEGSER